MNMKKALLLLAVLLPLTQNAFAQKGPAQINVISYNIRNGEANDGTNSWEYRYPASAIMKEGEQMSIFYNTKTIKLEKWGTFWLSETPDKPSMGWDAACKRTATWALLRHKDSGKRFYYVNTHLDHVGEEARRKGLDLIVERIDQINPEGYPMVLTGDFNVTPDDPALVGLDAKMKSARRFAAKTDDQGTYHGWGKESKVIDHIYFSGFSSCPLFEVVTKPYYERKFISDHYPVRALLVF